MLDISTDNETQTHTTMTPEKQRIAIHAARGQSWAKAEDGYWDLNGDNEGITDEELWERIPDYLNDLNAMMEAFEHLGKYWRITKAEDKFICTVLFAKQRKDVVVSGPELGPVMAEAFLRTLNLWGDEK